MNSAEVLILHGSPGSGKTTLARALAEHLREAGQANAVIDLDQLNLVHPSPGRSFALGNLKAIWPSYVAIPDLKVIIPTVLDDAEDLKAIIDVVPAAKFMICELIAPKSVLKDRVSAREPNDYWKDSLRRCVDMYFQRDASQKFGDFEVVTHDRSVASTAEEVIVKAGWTK